MYLGGQGGQRGYAMAALLVALGVMAVLMMAAMPVWRHQAQREREIETIFRGEQIARAIAMYREKNAGNFPTSLDILVQQRFLRKDFKNYFDEDGKWQPIGGMGTTQAQPGVGRGGQAQPGLPPPGGGQQLNAGQGIMGVTLKDKGVAIVEYKRATHHNEWTFMFSDARSRAGAAQGGRGGGPGRGGPAGPGGRGRGGPVVGPGGRGGPFIRGGGPGGMGGPGMGPGRGGARGGAAVIGGGRRGGGD